MRSWQRISPLKFMAMFRMRSLRQSNQENSPLSILPQHLLGTLGRSALLKVCFNQIYFMPTAKAICKMRESFSLEFLIDQRDKSLPREAASVL